MRLSLSGASSSAVSYLDDFASIAAFIQDAPLLKSFSENSATKQPDEAAIFIVVISFFAASSNCFANATKYNSRLI